MDLDELLTVIAAPLYANKMADDHERHNRSAAACAAEAVKEAEVLWRAVLDSRRK